MSYLRDKAWSITRRVIEGADARYGLRLYARVDEEELGAYSIWFISPKMNRRFGCWIDCFEEVPPERETRFVERLLHTAVRSLAEERDTQGRPLLPGQLMGSSRIVATYAEDGETWHG